MASIFTKIINKEAFCYKIAENNFCIAFLDLFPLKKGHTLVVPKLEVDQLFYLPKYYYNEVMNFSYEVAKAIQKAIICKRVALAVLGMEIPHAHIHLIPVDLESDFDFKKEKMNLNDLEMNEVVNRILKFI